MVREVLYNSAGSHVIINGKAGTGKTVVALALADYMTKFAGAHVRILEMRCMLQELLKAKFTETRTFEDFTCNQKIDIVKSRFKFKPEVYQTPKLRGYAPTYWIVDEAWAASAPMLDFLLEMAAIVVKGSLRIVCVGDHAQLPAIGIPAINSKIFTDPTTRFLSMGEASVRFEGDLIMKIVDSLRGSTHVEPSFADQELTALCHQTDDARPGLTIVATNNKLDEVISGEHHYHNSHNHSVLTVLPHRDRPQLLNRARRAAKLVANMGAVFTHKYIEPETERVVNNGTKAIVLTWGGKDVDEETTPRTRVTTTASGKDTAIVVLVRLYVQDVYDPEGPIVRVEPIINTNNAELRGAKALPIQNSAAMTAHRCQGYTAPPDIKIRLDCDGMSHVGQLIVAITRGQFHSRLPLHKQLDVRNYHPGMALQLAKRWDPEIKHFLDKIN